MKSILVFLAFSLSFAVHAESALSDLPKEDCLGKMARGINTSLSDGNITNCGLTHIQAFSVKADVKDWNETVNQLIKDNYGDDFKAKDDIEVDVKTFRKTSVKKTVDALMMSNDFNPKAKDIRSQLTRTVWAMLRQLEVDKTTQVIVGEVEAESVCGEGEAQVQSFLFVNPKTRKAVHFFGSEGFM